MNSTTSGSASSLINRPARTLHCIINLRGAVLARCTAAHRFACSSLGRRTGRPLARRCTSCSCGMRHWRKRDARSRRARCDAACSGQCIHNDRVPLALQLRKHFVVRHDRVADRVIRICTSLAPSSAIARTARNPRITAFKAAHAAVVADQQRAGCCSRRCRRALHVATATGGVRCDRLRS